MVLSYEGWNSRHPIDATDKSSRDVLEYIVLDATSEANAKAQVIGDFPLIYNGLKRKTVETARLGGDGSTFDYRLTATYVHPEKAVEDPSSDSFRFSFDTTGGTGHITQSLETISKTVAAGNARDFKQAINVSSSGILGTDVVIPMIRFTVSAKLDYGIVDLAYKKVCRDLTGKVCDHAFLGAAAEELLFLGAVGHDELGGEVEINWHWLESPNITNIDIGNSITIPAKNGHEVVWAFYGDEEDATAKALVKRPVQGNVERVYELSSMAGLQIPGA